MSENNYKYIWRCAKCSSHFANIISLEGDLKQEKKCPKCKSLNSLNLNNKEITIHCKQSEDNEDGLLSDGYRYNGPTE